MSDVLQRRSTSFKLAEQAALAGVEFSKNRKLSELVNNVTDAAVAAVLFPGLDIIF